MKNAKRVIIPVVIVLVVLLALNSCKDTLGAAIDQATGKADTVQEEDTTQWAELTSDPLSLEGIGDPSAKYAAAAVNSCLNIVFNGIWSRQTDYFTAPNGVITLTGYGTAEGTQKYGARWMAVPSMWTAAPIISRQTARTTAAPSAGWTRPPATGSPSPTIPAVITSTAD